MLLWIPAAVYGGSYLYLAVYHRQAWLFNTVVHENGAHTLLKSLFYASHFLGHVPSLTVISLLFAGVCLSILNPRSSVRWPPSLLTPILCSFLIAAALLSVLSFGRAETWAFFSQQMQGTQIEQGGGSWMLHLPSTLTLFVVIPLYIALAARVARTQIDLNVRGVHYLLLAAGLTLLFTVLFSDSLAGALSFAWTDPRYLAHSVRELATFPLTYFPIPLYFLLRDAQAFEPHPKPDHRSVALLMSFAAVSLAVVAYQCVVPLQAGIGGLAQRPDFAQGTLSIPYLLASHYFEHFLDTIYFTLVTLLLWNLAVRKTC